MNRPATQSMMEAVRVELAKHRFEYRNAQYQCSCGKPMGRKGSIHDHTVRDGMRDNHEIHVAQALIAEGMVVPAGDPRDRFLARQESRKPTAGKTPGTGSPF